MVGSVGQLQTMKIHWQLCTGFWHYSPKPDEDQFFT